MSAHPHSDIDMHLELPTLIDRFFEHLDKASTCTLYVRSGLSRDSFATLWETAQRCRCVLRQQGLRRGDIIALGVSTSQILLTTMLAAWADGIAISLVPHEVAEQSGRLSPAKLDAMLTCIDPDCLLLDEPLHEHVPAALREKVLYPDQLTALLQGCASSTERPSARGDDVAILQFTSGSTGLPKAAVITQAMLSANCAAIERRVEITGDDRMVSWLPMHHDMGLSAVTMAWWTGIDLVLLPTALFVRQPWIWLEAISETRGTLSPAPTSAYAMLTRFAATVARLKLDLSSWRYAWVGAEPVFDKYLRDFTNAMAPLGLRSHVLQPAYGMAESVVAVSLNRPGRAYQVVWADAVTLRREGRVAIRTPDEVGTVALVSNGPPIEGTQVAVRGPDQLSLPEARVGHLYIRGPSVIHGYLGQGSVCDQQGWYDTGDIGFMLDGEVYISGRAKDVITRSGLNIHAHEIELIVEDVLSLRRGSVAAFSYIDAELAQERVVVVVAQRQQLADENAARRAIAQRVVTLTHIQLDEIVFLKRSALPKTTSGKLQRAQLCSAHLRGELANAA